MNFVEFIQLKGICKTAAGHKIHDLRVSGWDKKYPIVGKIEWENGFLTEMVWDKEGFPHNLPLNHGLQLIGVVPRVEFDMINIKNITEVTTLESIAKEPKIEKKQSRNYA